MDIGNQIRERRTKMGLSQEELARRIYVSRQTVSNWETDRTYPDIQSLLLLSVLFDTTIDEIVKGDIEMMKESVERADVKRIKRFGAVMVAGLVLMFPFALLGVHLWGVGGVFLALVPWVPVMVVSFAIEKIKRDNDVYTYREILAFANRDEIDRSQRSDRLMRQIAAKKARPLAARIALAVGVVLVVMAIGFAFGYGVSWVVDAVSGA